MAECRINGYALPDENLTALPRTESDIQTSSSGRGETGVMNISYVRKGVRRIDVELVNITGKQLSELRAALSVKPQTVTVKDELGAEVTFSAYNGDISVTQKFIDSAGVRYFDISFPLTEL